MGPLLKKVMCTISTASYFAFRRHVKQLKGFMPPILPSHFIDEFGRK